MDKFCLVNVTKMAAFNISSIVYNIPSNLQYKEHQTPKLKCFSSRLAVVFAQSIEATC